MKNLEAIISGLQKQQERILHREKLLDSIIKSASEGILAFDNQFKVNVFNPSCEKIFKLEAEVAQSRNLSDLLDEAAFNKVRAYVENTTVEADRKPLEIDLEQTGTNSIKTLWSISEGNDSGESNHICIIYDLSRQTHAEKLLHERNDLFNTIIENAVDGFVMLDVSGRITKINPAALRLVGYKVGEVLGQSINILMPDEHAKMHDQHLQKYLETGVRHIIGRGREVPVLRKDGKVLPVYLSVSEVKFNEQVAFCGTMRDLSIQKEQERILIEQTMKRAAAEEQNFSITQSIKYARQIQQSILPSPEEMNRHLNHFVLFKPKESVSGDFYWIMKKNEFLFIAVVDCSGHGVPGGFMSLLGYTHLNYVVSQSRTNSPAKILTHLDQRINTALGYDKNKNHETKDGMDIALCRLNLDSHELIFAGARRPLLWCRNDSEFTELKADKASVGHDIVPGKTFSDHTIELTTGDTFYLFSDGLTDQINRDRSRYGKQRLVTYLATIQDRSMKEQGDALELEHFRWMSGEDQTDDLTVIGVRI